MYQKLASATSIQGSTIEMNEHAQSERSEAKTQPWKGKMGGQKLEIGLASAMLIFPMLTFAILLIGLVYRHRMPDNFSSYSVDNGTALPLGSAYFVNYSSTTLVYIASLSSTLSTVLIPAAMLLYSFVLAHYLAKDSDRAAVSDLPSPFQLDMLIRMIEGRLMVLWSYVRYAFGSKQRRTNVVPGLRHAFVALFALAVLAVLTNLADLWLHLGTKSVLYLELRPEQPSQAFAPGRGFNSTCLSHPEGTSGGYDVPISCMIYPNDAVNKPQLLNETEFFRTAANYSDVNQVYLSNGYAVLGPAKPPLDLDFQATSFGSQTSCRAVTGLCGAISTVGEREPYPSNFNFVCNSTMAGLNMTGNFLNVLAPLNDSGSSTGPAVTDARQGNNAFPALVVLGGNTIVGNSFSIGFQYFNDSQKLKQTPKLDGDYGSGEDRHQLYWALVWWAPFSTTLTPGYTQSVINDTLAWETLVTNETAAVGVSTASIGGSVGILSCETNISEVTMSFIDGTMGITSSSVPRTNASIPFVAGVTAQWGYDQLHAGLQQSFAAAVSSEDLAARFATFYDQTLVSIPAGVLLPLPVINASRRVETPVTRVPKAPFFAVILLDLLYATAGIVLTLSALAATARGLGARDVQARLSLAAVMAEGFENARLGDDAVDLEELYAERRGLGTMRVAFDRRDGGGRCYRLVGEKEGEDERRLL